MSKVIGSTLVESLVASSIIAIAFTMVVWTISGVINTGSNLSITTAYINLYNDQVDDDEAIRFVYTGSHNEQILVQHCSVVVGNKDLEMNKIDHRHE